MKGTISWEGRQIDLRPDSGRDLQRYSEASDEMRASCIGLQRRFVRT
jgi:hypothetical protein